MDQKAGTIIYRHKILNIVIMVDHFSCAMSIIKIGVVGEQRVFLDPSSICSKTVSTHLCYFCFAIYLPTGAEYTSTMHLYRSVHWFLFET